MSLYVVTVPGFTKVGHAKNPEVRLRDYQCENPLVDQFAAVFPGTRDDEKAIQAILEERFERKNQTEWFIGATVEDGRGPSCGWLTPTGGRGGASSMPAGSPASSRTLGSRRRTTVHSALDLFPSPLQRQRVTIAKADAVEWLESLPPESAHLVVTDPAYESLEKHRAVGTTTRLTGEWFDIFPNARFPELFREAFRVLVPNAHLYMFCDQETMFVARPLAEAAGFRFWKFLVWDKCKIGMGYHYRARHELILFFEKGKRKLADLGVADVITVPSIRGGYPTEKPPEVAEVLVAQSSSPGEVVVDPFLGSGSTGVAALRHGRRFAGCDTSEKAIEVATARLSEEGST